VFEEKIRQKHWVPDLIKKLRQEGNKAAHEFYGATHSPLLEDAIWDLDLSDREKTILIYLALKHITKENKIMFHQPPKGKMVNRGYLLIYSLL